MKTKYILILLVIAFVVSLVGAVTLYANQQTKVKMKYADYLTELQMWKDREQAALTKIKDLEARRDALRNQLADLDRQIKEADDAYWRELGTDAAGLRAYLDELRRIRDQIQGYLRMTPEQLFERRAEAQAVEPRFNELAARPASKHPDARTIIAEIRGLLQQLRDALARAQAKPKFDIYTVVRGDYLWKISKKPDIYNDPFKWLWIYTKNRDIIKNPDLIYPSQEFKIFKEVLPGEYMVKKGDNLKKIAGEVYSDPFKWSALYELNKTVIKDKNIIYPYMILYTK
jgi:hypothetical protein